MDLKNKIKPYLAGELPMEEAQALERALADDPEAYELHHLDQDLTRYGKGELDMELNGWLPGLEALQHSGIPLWLMSLVTGTLVVGMAGTRPARRKKQKRPVSLLEAPSQTEGHPASDAEAPPGGVDR